MSSRSRTDVTLRSSTTATHPSDPAPHSFLCIPRARAARPFLRARHARPGSWCIVEVRADQNWNQAYCADIPRCTEPEATLLLPPPPRDCYDGVGEDYRGNSSDTLCMPWTLAKLDVVFPNAGLGGGHSFCRNPMHAVVGGPQVPFCINSINAQGGWSYMLCSYWLPQCTEKDHSARARTSAQGANALAPAAPSPATPPPDCYDAADSGASYRGEASKTSAGRACLQWPADLIADYPNSGLGAHAFCRNPDESEQPCVGTSRSRAARARAHAAPPDSADLPRARAGLTLCSALRVTPPALPGFWLRVARRTLSPSPLPPSRHSTLPPSPHAPTGLRRWCFIEGGKTRKWDDCAIVACVATASSLKPTAAAASRARTAVAPFFACAAAAALLVLPLARAWRAERQTMPPAEQGGAQSQML